MRDRLLDQYEVKPALTRVDASLRLATASLAASFVLLKLVVRRRRAFTGYSFTPRNQSSFYGPPPLVLPNTIARYTPPPRRQVKCVQLPYPTPHMNEILQQWIARCTFMGSIHGSLVFFAFLLSYHSHHTGCAQSGTGPAPRRRRMTRRSEDGE